MITFHLRALVLLGLFLVPGLATPGQSQHEVSNDGTILLLNNSSRPS